MHSRSESGVRGCGSAHITESQITERIHMAAKRPKTTQDTRAGGATPEITPTAPENSPAAPESSPTAARSGKSEGKTTRESATTAKNAPAKRGRSGGARAAKQGDDKEADLRKELRGFAESHTHGWSHDEWTGLLGSLQERGFDTSEPDRLGLELEKERLALKLEKVTGLGPARVRSLTEQFGTLWSLRHADVEQISSAGGIPRAVAERVTEALR
ncbi:hypothetical protein BH23GEM3_BH23GEM3_21390 [soil metagenome]